MEAFRRIVGTYHQFPWWNPWTVGGFPSFASPVSAGAFSAVGIVSLALGTTAALRWTTLACALFGFWGMARLARRATDDPVARAIAGILFSCNGAIVLHLCAGHLFVDYFLFPWLLEALVELNERGEPRTAVAAGLLLAITVHQVLQYGFVYMLLTVAGFFALGLIQGTPDMRRRLPGAYALAGLVLLAGAGFRLVLAAAVMRDYPRHQRFEVAFDAGRLVRMFVQPGQTFSLPQAAGLGWWEWGFYLGVVSLLLFAYSALTRPRISHVVFLAGVLAFVSTAHWNVWYWLNEYVPPFKSMRVAARIRIWIVPAFAFGVVAGLEALKRRSPRFAHVCAAVIAIDLTANGFYAFRRAFAADMPGPRIEEHANLRPWPDVFCDQGYDFSLYWSVRNGYSHTPGYEPSVTDLLRAMPRETRPLACVNESGYPGAFYTAAGSVTPSSWSPNRVEFENVREPLRLNVNPGSYWRVNGRDVFARMKVADIAQPFVAMPDANGRVVVEIVPKWLTPAALTSAIAAVLAAILFIQLRGQARRS